MKLGELLTGAGLLSQEKLAFALREHKRTGLRLGQILVDHRLVPEATLFDALAQITKLPRLNLASVEIENDASATVTAEWAMATGMIPIRIDPETRTLLVATADPTFTHELDDLRFRTGLKIQLLLGSNSEVQRLIRHIYYQEPLDRSVAPQGPGAARDTGEIVIEESMIMHSMGEMRDQLQGTGDAPLMPPSSDSHREILSRLKPIFDAQQDAAQSLRAIFELCVQNGIVSREEYFERLKQN